MEMTNIIINLDGTPPPGQVDLLANQHSRLTKPKS